MSDVVTLEKSLLKFLLESEENGVEYAFAMIEATLDFSNEEHLWMISRNLYHVVYARHHSLIDILTLVKMISEKIPIEMRICWEDALSIPIVSETYDEDEICCLEMTAYESNYFFGYLAHIGVVNLTNRMKVLEHRYSEDASSAVRRILMKAIFPVIFSCNSAFLGKLPSIHSALLSYLEESDPRLFAEILRFEENAIDPMMITPAQKPGFDPSIGEKLSIDAYLHLIISSDDAKLLQKVLCENNFDVDRRVARSLINTTSVISHGPTLLHLAAFYGSIECFKYLIMNHADPALVDLSKSRLNAVDFAVIGGNLEIVRHCQQAGLQLNGAIFKAVMYHRSDIFHWLIENGFAEVSELDENGMSLMSMAAATNNIQVAEFLYQHGECAHLEMESEFASPLSQACSVDCLSIVRIICENEESIPSEEIEEAFHEAVLGNSQDVVRYLIGKFGSYVTHENISKLISMAEKSKLERMAILLSASVK